MSVDVDMSQKSISIGASAGAFHVLVDLVSQLPADLPVPVFVVMHVPASHPSQLPAILSNAGPFRAIHPEDGTKIERGVIYVAPPDHHLLVDGGYVAVKRGPKENGFRPSIDALFRSAAYAYGHGAIGVVLSGALNDGTSGLWTIKRLGGIAIVQDPYEAKYPSMPRSALEYVEADYKVRSTEIAPLLARLTQEQPSPETDRKNLEEGLEERIAKEVQIAAGSNISHKSVLDLGELTTFACPDCHGALIRIKEGNLSRFRCHTGHGFTEDVLLEKVMQTTGEMIWQVTRGLQEAEMVLEHMGQHIRDQGDSARAEKFFAKAREIASRAVRFQDVAQDHESLSSENLEQYQPSND
jgi:two-component system, chemotaxis family, protein-glutamate methylesterase/glutaminase